MKIPAVSTMINYKLTHEAFSEIFNSDHPLITCLESSKVFEMDDDISTMLLLTNNDQHFVKLPFRNIFLDSHIYVDHGRVMEEVAGLLVTSNPLPYEYVASNPPPIEDNFWIFCISKFYIPAIFDAEFGPEDLLKLFNDLPKVQYHISGIDGSLYRKDIQRNVYSSPFQKDFRDKIIMFVMNFIDFLNDPEVELRQVVRTEKSNLKRKKKNKLPLPSSNIVVIKGKLYEYVNALKSHKHFSYSHRFWVRGHWRLLLDEKWKYKRGTKIWIPPFIKGEGILITKTYRIEL